MPASPQSQFILGRLLNGECVTSGDVSVGPLSANTRVLLRVLIDDDVALKSESGAAQAKKLRDLYVSTKTAKHEAARGHSEAGAGPAAANGASGSSDVEQTEPREPSAADAGPARWKLDHLSCRLIRGVDPSGEPLDFPFGGRSTLIFGPNGSGKSSLLGAIVWVLTGQVITDADDDAEKVALYRPPRADADRGSKLCDWPVVLTLPQSGSPAAATPQCSAELELRSTGGTVLWVRRSLSAGVETSRDGVSWAPRSSLADHGIASLDLQLSLIAPTVFGRLTIEQAKDTRSLLSLMLGYDELEALGDFASRFVGNRARLANEEQRDLHETWTKLQQELQALPNMLPAQSDFRERVSAVAAIQKPTQEQITEIGEAVNQEIKATEKSLAELLGIAQEGEGPPDGIADKLTTAIAAIDKGVWANFPSLAEIRVEAALPEKDGVDPNTRFSQIVEKTDTFLSSARTRIAQRLDWWRKEIEPGSKAALWLRAAQDYDPESALCPVCERSVEGLTVKDELAGLKAMDPELQHEVRIFFRNLSDELKEAIPGNLMALAESLPQARVLHDWSSLCETTLGSVLRSIAAQFDERIQQLAAEAPAVPSVPIDLLSEDAESAFAEQASELVESVRKAKTAIAMLEWSETNLPGLQQFIHETVTRPEGEGALSLLAALSKGKQAAADVVPLAIVRDEFRRVYNNRKSIAAREADLAVLAELAASLDQLKSLAKYAGNEVSTVFGCIRDRTIDNWRLLYPEKSSGLDPARLVLGKGRDKTVEALLGCGTYEAPGKFFANAGLQRAIALSFFFALLEKHPNGLGFVIMDDPILSLDEDHRESWSANILKPVMDRVQVILATHQRQYLNHCKHDFCNGTVVELNPRTRSSRMSWRPGFRLDRAEEELRRAPTNAPVEMRKYREELLCTLDAYSPAPFFNAANLTQSLRDYSRLVAPHPLAGHAQTKIVELLNEAEISRVLDPGSHHLTEADVTAAMSQQCLAKLRQCDEKLRYELVRLERLRAHERRARALPILAEGPLGVPDAARWADPIRIQALGRAAAKQDSWVCDASDNSWDLILPPGAAVVARAGTLEPVARPGQWLLIAAEDVVVRDGDLAIATAGGRRLLRRAWTHGMDWHLTSINPVRPRSPVVATRSETTIRKVVGVLYEPLRPGGLEHSCEEDEWQPRVDFDPGWLAALHAIAVEGDSLEPLARRGQKVFVGGKQAPAETVLEQGGLAVLETNDDSVGNVIKRVFRHRDQWVLVSPNLVEPHEPLLLSTASIVAVWPLRGVLFDSQLDSEP